jgi:predicted transposase YbfD/YdcC
MENKTPLFLDEFKDLEDPRSTRNRLHSMSEILLVTLAAVICGCETWNDIEDYGRIKLDFLKTLLPFKNGAPSDDTLRRFFRAVDVDQFQELFRTWMKSILKLMNEEHTDKTIAIDGKSLRGSTNDQGSMLHMISAYSTELRLVLGQEKVSDKSNEITAIPKLLEWLDLKGSTVTIDAMGCQYKIADQIKEKKGDYILSLKGNQGTLHEDVKLYLDNEKDCNTYIKRDKEHGRIEKRQCYVSHDIKWLQERHPQWDTIQSIIKIDSERTIKDTTTKEARYFVSSLTLDAEQFLNRIRSHWSIENSLHWVLDMSFGEDQSKIRKDNAPQAMAIVRHIALNLIQTFKSKYPKKRYSIKRLRKMSGWDNSVLLNILSHHH